MAKIKSQKQEQVAGGIAVRKYKDCIKVAGEDFYGAPYDSYTLDPVQVKKVGSKIEVMAAKAIDIGDTLVFNDEEYDVVSCEKVDNLSNNYHFVVANKV